MKKKQVKFLKKLVETPSPTGSEERVAEIVREHLDAVSDEVRTDTMGSVHAVLNAFVRPGLEPVEPVEPAEPQPDPVVKAMSRAELAAIRPEQEAGSALDEPAEEFVDEVEEVEDDYDPDYIEDEPFEVQVGSSSVGIPMPAATPLPEKSWNIEVLDAPSSQKEDAEGPAPVVMLSAHMDEIGLMVTYITEDGFLYVSSIGGVDAAILPGLRVDVHTQEGTLRGIVGRKPIHLIDAEERKSVTSLDKLVIDLGLPAKTVRKKVQVGDSITFGVGFEEFGKGMAVSRALDDKCGVFVACRVMEELAEADRLAATFVAAITVQEEIGTRGAITSAHSIDPDVAIAFDVTHATDYPGIDKTRFGSIECGRGPVIAKGPNINPLVFDRLVAAARKEGIPYQIEAEPSVTGTDARSIQVSREGVPTGLVSVPLRYMHTPTEAICLDDLANAVRLITRFVQDLEPDATFIPGVSPAIEMPADPRRGKGSGAEERIERLQEEVERLKSRIEGTDAPAAATQAPAGEPSASSAPKKAHWETKPQQVSSAKLPHITSLNTLTSLASAPASSTADEGTAPIAPGGEASAEQPAPIALDPESAPFGKAQSVRAEEFKAIELDTSALGEGSASPRSEDAADEDGGRSGLLSGFPGFGSDK